VPLARYVAEHEHDLAFPFRRYQMQRVYRASARSAAASASSTSATST
jgi:histidyl-tRNA synthetase